MILILWATWILYLGAFVYSHLQVRRQRRGQTPERRVRRASLSNWGIAIQFTGVVLALVIHRNWNEPQWLAIAGFALAWLGIIITWAALAHLGRQWRLTAVVTDDHELIVNGPYRLLRHPVYSAFFLILLGTILLITNWVVGAISIVLFFIGTELRIAAEERVLAAHFSDAYEAYRDRTAAWFPPFH